MNAPSPPPTIPSLILPPFLASLRPSMAMGLLPSLQSERAVDLLLVDRAGGEIVERLVGHADHVLLDELSALARAVLRVLEAAFPFEHRPGRVAVLRQLREDAAEIDLPIAERAETARPLDPWRIAGIDALPSGRIELAVLDVKRLDPLVVDVDEFEIVELLQHEVRRVVVDRTALVAADRVEEALEGRAVEQVLSRMELVANVDARVVEGVEDRFPALRKLFERGLDQPGRALRPGVDEGPGQRAGKRGMRCEPQALRRLGAFLQMLDRPLLPLRRLAPNLLGGETVKGFVIGWVYGDELSRDVTCEFGDRQAMRLRGPAEFIAIGLRLSSFADVDEAINPGRDLHALVAQRRRPLAHAAERIKRRCVAGELRQKNRRALNQARHDLLLLSRAFLVPLPLVKKGKRANALPRILPYQNGESLK